MDKGREEATRWFSLKNWAPFTFQKDAWKAFAAGKSGLLNAPTGSGKTYALFMPMVIDYINHHEEAHWREKGLKMLWITPLRALTKDITQAMQAVCRDLQLPITIAMRTGDTSLKERQAIKKSPPDILLTTPESIHILLSQSRYDELFKHLIAIVVDEWHELLGTKRGVLIELALSRLKGLKKVLPEKENPAPFRIWGISATIGNLEEAAEVLLGSDFDPTRSLMIKSEIEKKTEVQSIIPDNVEEYSWTGHLGIKLLHKVMPIIEQGGTTLLFTNTRSQAEIWYHSILNGYPEYAGIMAMHHGSLDNELRSWVEEALHAGTLKLVVSTSSLDLGVDFRPVDTVIQVGSPKGVSRFMQRAGRSGHSPGEVSKIFFVPTHSLELMEGAALKQAMLEKKFENRDPMRMTMDVLMQYLVTLAVSDGFEPRVIYQEVITTHVFQDLTYDEFVEVVYFISRGGKTLSQYDDFIKVEEEEGLFIVKKKKTAMQHRLSIGTIVGATSVRVKYINGGSLGTVEESFISQLKIGDHFWFAGRSLELVRFKDMTAFVKKSLKPKGIIPSWDGGRMPLSSQLSAVLRSKIGEAAAGLWNEPEMVALKPVFDIQEKESVLPAESEFLIEKLATKEGWHLFFYPFEGRVVHEGLSSLIAYRLTRQHPATFSIAMNDYGFELLSDRDTDERDLVDYTLYSQENLVDDILHSLNANEMAKRKFREIAHIAGLVFTGYPGKLMSNRHLQAGTSLLFEVFREYEPDNFLVRQAYQEALQYQLEEYRLRAVLARIQTQKIIFKTLDRPSPFSFPILVDNLSREKFTTETLEQRVHKMIKEYA